MSFNNPDTANKVPSTQLSTAVNHAMAVILAGRRGPELHQLTEKRSKAAVPFAGKFKIIDFPLSNCVNSGIRRIGVATQYSSHTLNQHIQRGWNFMRSDFNEFIELWPPQKHSGSENWYAGSADVLQQNLPIMLESNPRYIILLDGYHVYKQDYSVMLKDHIENDADVTISCVEVSMQAAQQMETLTVDSAHRCMAYHSHAKVPKAMLGSDDRCLVNAGAIIFNTDFLIEKFAEKNYQNIGIDFLPSMVESSLVYAHRFEKSCIQNTSYPTPYWQRIESLQDYWVANMDLTKLQPELNLYDDAWPIRTMHYQRPAAKFNYNYEERIGTALNSVVSAGCIVSGATVDQSILFNNVKVDLYSKLFKCVVLPRCEIKQHCRLNKVVLDQDCIVPDGLVIGENPALDAERFYRDENGITLVTNEMLHNLR